MVLDERALTASFNTLARLEYRDDILEQRIQERLAAANMPDAELSDILRESGAAAHKLPNLLAAYRATELSLIERAWNAHARVAERHMELKGKYDTLGRAWFSTGRG